MSRQQKRAALRAIAFQQVSAVRIKNLRRDRRQTSRILARIRWAQGV